VADVRFGLPRRPAGSQGHASHALHNSLFRQSLALAFSLRPSRAYPISPRLFARRNDGPAL